MVRRPTYFKFAGILFIVTFLSGCVSSASKQKSSISAATKLQPEQQCQRLAEIFNKSINGFRSIREQPRYLNKVTRWQTRYHLINNSCDIWQWSDKYSYICSEVIHDKDMADNLYDEAGKIISHCLNESHISWQQQQTALEKQGIETRYSINGLLRGTLRKVNTGGLFQNSWTIYFRVDSPELGR